MKKFFPLLISMLLFSFSSTFPQLLVEEFNYSVGDSLIQHGYTAHSGGTTNGIRVISGNLSYSGYPSSGIGNMIQVVNTGQDVHDSLSSLISSGTLYAAMLVNVDSARNAGDYFFHFAPAPIGTSFRARIFVKLGTNGNLAFGLSKGTTSATVLPVYSDSAYNAGTTYLLVVAYKFVDGTANDTVKLWINPLISSAEPAANLIVSDTSTTGGDITIGTFAFRQGTAASGPYFKLDGLRIDTSWADAVVPVELISFTASSQNSSIQLNWTTVTEINNRGFEIERSIDNKSFEKIGFVNGSGTTTQLQSYSFVDNNLESANKYYYRLKQVDYDGSFSYSQVVDINVNSTPSNYSFMQTYPNPFNPNTTLSFSLPKDSKVTVKIFDLLGREVYKLVNDNLSAGNYNYEINFSNFASGIYLYRLEAYGSDGSSFSTTKKMTLTK